MRCDEVRILVVSFVIFCILKILEPDAAAGRSSLACSKHVQFPRQRILPEPKWSNTMCRESSFRVYQAIFVNREDVRC